MPLFIHQIACEVPEHQYLQSDIAVFIAQAYGWDSSRTEALKRFYHETHIITRYSVLPDFRGAKVDGIIKTNLPGRMQFFKKEAFSLARKAVSKLMQSLPALQPDALITVSCTGLSAPGWDLELMNNFGWTPSWRTAVNFLGCHGLFHALKIADALVAQQPSLQVLIVAAELCTIHFDTIDRPDQHRAHALFADGACALLCSGRHNRDALATISAFSSRLVPDEGQSMTWDIGNNTFLMNLTSDVPHLIRENLKNTVENCLAYTGLNVSDVVHYAIHPGGKKIIREVGQVLALQENQLQPALHVLNNFGNMSSVSIAFVLDYIFGQKVPGVGIALGFGPGLTIECMTFEVL